MDFTRSLRAIDLSVLNRAIQVIKYFELLTIIWFFILQGMASPSFGGTFAIPVSATVQPKPVSHVGGTS